MKDTFFVVGPTAVGKTALAIELAEKFDAEIVNADAFQVYRGLDVLTAKPDAEAQRRVRHHLLGQIPLSETMSAAIFRELACGALADIHLRKKTADVVRGPRSATAATVYGVLLLRDRADLYQRINDRVNAMFRAGVEKEVRVLPEVGPTADSALGLEEIRALIAGQISREECIAKIQQATRRYAKRQLTWFRHQTSFPPLNLTPFSHREAVRAITQMFRRAQE